MIGHPSIEDLVGRFARQEDSYVKNTSYKEAQVRKEFIDPMFKNLGWDVDNEQGFAELYKDVVHEDSIRIDGLTKAPDYAFRIGGNRKFFVEAKRPSIRIKDDAQSALQLRRYGWSAKLTLSVVTNFRELAIYDTRVKPVAGDSAGKACVLFMTFEEYEARWSELADLLSKNELLKGALESFGERKRLRGTVQVDDAILNEIDTWRSLLAGNVAARNASLSARDLNLVVQATVDRIIFLRICEDRGIEPPGQLLAVTKRKGHYGHLCDLFRGADERYNSGLFHFRKERGRGEPTDEVSLALRMDDAPLSRIIKSLYFPESSYEFSVVGADILGQVYERFLGQTITLTGGKKRTVVIEAKPEVKKAGGVYYTPEHIVDFIVRQTLEPCFEGKGLRQVADVRIVDPACGSGSFLIRAYQYLLDWYRELYLKATPAMRKDRLRQTSAGGWRLTSSERKRILLTHIFGVDLDRQAVEVTKLSLLLKVLEGESQETIDAQLKLFRERALPDLGFNVKCGNSLIAPDFYDGKTDEMFDDDVQHRVNPFDWKTEFASVMAAGGFHAVLGNPPYIRVRTYKELFPEEAAYLEARYACATHVWDVYGLFFERALGLCRSGGFVSFIVPIQTLHQPNNEVLRDMLLRQTSVETVADLSHLKVFDTAIVKTCILTCRKDQPKSAGSTKNKNANEGIRVLEPRIATELTTSPGRRWPQAEVLANPGLSLRVDMLSDLKAVCDAMREHSRELSEHAYVTFGLRSCAKGKGQGGKDRLITTIGTSPDAKPYLEGREIARYAIEPPSERFIHYRPAEMYSPRSPALFETRKIVSQSMLSRMRPVAALDENGYFVEQSLVCIVPHGTLTPARPGPIPPMEFLLASINSRYQTFYFGSYIIDHSLGGGLIHATPGTQERFLVPKTTEAKAAEVAKMVRELGKAKAKFALARTAHDREVLSRRVAHLDAEIDRAIAAAFDLTAAEARRIEETLAQRL